MLFLWIAIVFPIWRTLLILPQHIKALFDSGVVNAKELIRSGNHIDLVWLALGTLTVKELESGFVVVLQLQNAAHHLK